MIILIMRHGETDLNKEKYFFNSKIDCSLNKGGIEQTKKIREFLKKENIDIIYSSPYKRTRETAEIIRSGFKNKPPIRIDNRLSELDFGIFDGKSLSYVKKHYRRIYNERRKNKFQYKIQGGESYKMV